MAGQRWTFEEKAHGAQVAK